MQFEPDPFDDIANALKLGEGVACYDFAMIGDDGIGPEIRTGTSSVSWFCPEAGQDCGNTDLDYLDVLGRIRLGSCTRNALAGTGALP